MDILLDTSNLSKKVFRAGEEKQPYIQ
jgi:hypothetical protein